MTLHSFELPASRKHLVVVVCVDPNTAWAWVNQWLKLQEDYKDSISVLISSNDKTVLYRLHEAFPHAHVTVAPATIPNLAKLAAGFGMWTMLVNEQSSVDHAYLSFCLKSIGALHEFAPKVASLGRSLTDPSTTWFDVVWNTNALMAGNTTPLQLWQQGWTSTIQTDTERSERIPDFDSMDLTIVTLFAGRLNLLREWEHRFMMLDLPPDTRLHVVDNSQGRQLRDHLMASPIKSRVTEFSYTREDRAQTWTQDYHDWNKHQHIGNMYNRAFGKVKTRMVLAWEDDVFPHNPQALRRLHSLMHRDFPDSAAAAAVYPSGNTPSILCLARNMESWTDCLPIKQMTRNVIPVGFVGAGFTLYRTDCVRAALPTVACKLNGRPAGWDAYLSKRIRDNGGKIYAHQDVRADHYAGGTKQYCLEP